MCNAIETYMHYQRIVQVNPKGEPLVAVQMDRVYFGKLLDKYSVQKKLETI